MANNFDEVFDLIEAESLSLREKFMRYKPQTTKEKLAKALITEAIKKGVKNFYRPKYDPSIAENGGIQFVAGKKPALDKTYEWWDNAAKLYNPERNSRLGTRLEYGAFLGVLIKTLVEQGNSIEWAWQAVCWDSKELGHYWNSENAKHNYEPTGSRYVGGFYDLGNTIKILKEEGETGGFWNAGGCFHCFSFMTPLSYLYHDVVFNGFHASVGWIVCS